MEDKIKTKITNIETLREMGKYYTPKIEDLFVGYEMEIFVHKARTPSEFEFSYEKITVGGEDPYSLLFTGEFINSSKIDISRCRTPYLTKEQIEAEGWESVNLSPEMFEKAEHLLIIYPNNKIEIRHLGNPSYTTTTSYLGFCPSINEFRKIMSWLQIHPKNDL